MKRTTPLLLILLFSGVILTSCKEAEEEVANNIKLNIHMLHYVGNDEAEYDTIRYTNALGNAYSVVRLQYFISDFRLQKTDGTEVFIDEAHYVDASIPESLVYTPGEKIPEGNYESISFIFGLSAEKNTNGRFPNPPENNMEWPPALGSGYHYMKLEGKIDSSGVISNYQAHTGPTNGNQNFIQVDLSQAAFEAKGSEKTIFIKMNINNWWENPNTFDLNQMSGIMGNQQIQEKLRENGVDVFTFEPIITLSK